MIRAARKRKFIQLLAIVIVWPLFLITLDMSLKETSPRPLPLAEAGFAQREPKTPVSGMAAGSALENTGQIGREELTNTLVKFAIIPPVPSVDDAPQLLCKVTQ